MRDALASPAVHCAIVSLSLSHSRRRSRRPQSSVSVLSLSLSVSVPAFVGESMQLTGEIRDKQGEHEHVQ